MAALWVEDDAGPGLTVPVIRAKVVNIAASTEFLVTDANEGAALTKLEEWSK